MVKFILISWKLQAIPVRLPKAARVARTARILRAENVKLLKRRVGHARKIL